MYCCLLTHFYTLCGYGTRLVICMYFENWWFYLTSITMFNYGFTWWKDFTCSCIFQIEGFQQKHLDLLLDWLPLETLKVPVSYCLWDCSIGCRAISLFVITFAKWSLFNIYRCFSVVQWATLEIDLEECLWGANALQIFHYK